VKPGVTTAPPASLTTKHKVIDELDDDATEMGELPPELMGLIAGMDSSASPEPPTPAALPPKKTDPATPIPRKSVSAPPKVSPAPVSERGVAARPTGGVTSFDRPPTSRPLPEASPAPYDSGPNTKPSLPEVSGGTLTGDEPDTGPEAPIIDGALASRPSGPMMVKTGDIEPDDDDADMKTVVGTGIEIPGLTSDGASTALNEAANPPEPEPTKAVAPPPRMSAPKPSTGQQRAVVRRSSTSIPSQRKEPTGVSPKKVEEPVEESPPWMHPYVLVTGGLLLLALGFLIGVLLR
jgi:hypothetical protein